MHVIDVVCYILRMRNQLHVQFVAAPQPVVKFAGHFGEAAEIAVPPVAGRILELDFRELLSINSSGLRILSEWTRRLDAARLDLSFCPPFFVQQLNIVVGLLPSGSRVLSFFVPYCNGDTSVERFVLLEHGRHFQTVDGEPRVHFPEVKDQGQKLEPDVAPGYFNFLKSYA